MQCTIESDVAGEAVRVYAGEGVKRSGVGYLVVNVAMNARSTRDESLGCENTLVDIDAVVGEARAWQRLRGTERPIRLDLGPDVRGRRRVGNDVRRKLQDFQNLIGRQVCSAGRKASCCIRATVPAMNGDDMLVPLIVL